MKKSFVFMIAAVLFVCLLAGCTVIPAPTTSIPKQEAPEVSVPVEQPTVDIPSEAQPMTVRPLPVTVDVENLTDCTLAVSLKPSDFVTAEDGTVSLTATVYVHDLYDMVDMSMLQEGDEIEILGETVTVDSLERTENGVVLINGGLDVGGHEFVTEDNTVYFERGYSDVRSYYSIGEVTLPVSSVFLFTDMADLDNEPVVYGLTELLAKADTIMDHFVPHNTKLIVEAGVVTHMQRVYMP